MIEGVVATSFLILATFGIIEFSGYLKKNADLSRILQQTAVGISEASSCSNDDTLQNIEFLPDDEDTLKDLTQDTNSEDSQIKKLIKDFLKLSDSNLNLDDYTIKVDLYADAIGSTAQNNFQIITGYVWMGIKLKEPTSILGISGSNKNCQTLLTPIPTSFDRDDLVGKFNTAKTLSPSNPLKPGGINSSEGCPRMTGYTPYQWKPVAESIAASNTFCERT